jgi:hypothetical protein
MLSQCSLMRKRVFACDVKYYSDRISLRHRSNYDHLKGERGDYIFHDQTVFLK